MALRVGVAPAVLLAIAVAHSVAVETTHLTPWEGGGFGMFSTVDRGQARFLRTYLITPDREVRVELPPSVREYVWRLRVLPDTQRVQRLARVLADAPWVAEPLSRPVRVQPATRTAPHDAADHPRDRARSVRYRVRSGHTNRTAATHVDVRGVRVEVWRYHFDPSGAALTARILVEATARRSDGSSRVDP